MVNVMCDGDAHRKPPEQLRPIFKLYQRATIETLSGDEDLIDLQDSSFAMNDDHISECGVSRPDSLNEAFTTFLNQPPPVQPQTRSHFKLNQIPGELDLYWEIRTCLAAVDLIFSLHIIPQLLPPEVQLLLLERLIHRDLIDSRHKTNVHLHHDVQYPDNSESFFSFPPDTNFELPGREATRQPMSLASFLRKKLRWITLGGQYDWTAKRYPDEVRPPFPVDIAELVHSLFPDMRAEAAIVNFYSPGDTLSLHRDISEECDRPLVSISIGCDAIFMAALEDETGSLKHVAIRVRSGDAVYMSGESRYAWHGVPQVVAGTCPEWLSDWPAPQYEAWKGWMANKRINLNVRQMYE